MKTTSAKKVTVNVDSREQQINTKNTRRTLKVLQETADKENLVGRNVKDTKIANEKTSVKSRKLDTKEAEAQTDAIWTTLKRDDSPTSCKIYESKAVQTGPSVTADDLTSDEPSEDYWRLLAEKRGESLNESLQENERLKEHIDTLKEENKICKEMLEESKHLVDVLQEMLEEESPAEIAEVRETDDS